MALDGYAAVFSNAAGSNHLITTTSWATFIDAWNESVDSPICLTHFDSYRENSSAIWYTGVWTKCPPTSSCLFKTTEWPKFIQKHEECSVKARLLDFNVHSGLDRERHYAGSWGSEPVEQIVLHDLPWHDFLQEWFTLSALGWRLNKAQIYPGGNYEEFHIAGIFEQAAENFEGYGLILTVNWTEFHVACENTQTLHLVDYQVYDDDNGIRWFFGVWRRQRGSHEQRFVFDQNYHNLFSQIQSFSGEGFNPQQIIRYPQAKRSPKPDWDFYISTILSPVTQGYAYVVLRNGQSVAQGYYGNTRNEKDNLSAWSLNSRMHLASISKAVAGVAVLKLLSDRNISVDATFWDPYMRKQIPVVGPGVENITIRQLLNMTSGMDDYLQAIMFNESDYWSILSDYLANQTVTLNDFVEYYSNTNFLILQGLADSLLGNKGHSPSQYHEYVLEEVLRPMDIDLTQWTLHDDPIDIATLSYSNPPTSTEHGHWFGDVQNICGAGWVAPAIELAKFLVGVRNNTILNASTNALMLDGNLGWDHYQNHGMYGRYYHKNGNFFTEDGRGLRAGIVMLPFGYNVLLMTNTWLSAAELDPVMVIMDAFESGSSPLGSVLDKDQNESVNVGNHFSFSKFIAPSVQKTGEISRAGVVDALQIQNGRLWNLLYATANAWFSNLSAFIHIFDW